MNAHLSPQFKSGLQKGLSAVTAGLTAGMATAAYAIPQMTHEAPELWPNDNPAQIDRVQRQRDAMPDNIPDWHPRLGRQFEGYVNAQKQPVGASKGTWPESHLVVKQDASTVEMSPQEVAKRMEAFGGSKQKGDDVWIVGNRWPAGTNVRMPKPHPTLDLGTLG